MDALVFLAQLIAQQRVTIREKDYRFNRLTGAWTSL